MVLIQPHYPSRIHYDSCNWNHLMLSRKSVLISLSLNIGPTIGATRHPSHLPSDDWVHIDQQKYVQISTNWLIAKYFADNSDLSPSEINAHSGWMNILGIGNLTTVRTMTVCYLHNSRKNYSDFQQSPMHRCPYIWPKEDPWPNISWNWIIFRFTPIKRESLTRVLLLLSTILSQEYNRPGTRYVRPSSVVADGHEIQTKSLKFPLL